MQWGVGDSLLEIMGKIRWDSRGISQGSLGEFSVKWELLRARQIGGCSQNGSRITASHRHSAILILRQHFPSSSPGLRKVRLRKMRGLPEDALQAKNRSHVPKLSQMGWNWKTAIQPPRASKRCWPVTSLCCSSCDLPQHELPGQWCCDCAQESRG